ncbi:MAG: TlpA family protein disulfide reductase [Syntrophaceae bacterium]|nr:TlpA family protein disulfide reductase [Syntrophaceae bacterium]
MKKGINLMFALVAAGTFLVPPIQAQDSSLRPQHDCPSCVSFGVQRFRERKEALSFSLRHLDGNTVALNDLKGKPLLLVFWASWCDACKEDIPILQKFLDAKKDQLAQLNVYAIAIDGEKEKRVQRVVKKYKITLPVLLDEKERLARKYGVQMVPTVFLVTKDGLVEGKIVGQRDWTVPEAWHVVKELLMK